VSASLGESAVQLPWLAPGVAALAALARREPPAHPAVAADPAAVLLLLRFPDDSRSALSAALAQLRRPRAGVLDHPHPAGQTVLAAARQYARAARLLAERTGAVDPGRAWAAGLLAPLGWLAMAATDPAAVAACRSDSLFASDPAAVQRRLWGATASSVARRLARRWDLPAWLAAVVGHLELPAGTAPADDQDVPVFILAQAAVALAGRSGDPLRLPVGTPLDESLPAIGLVPAAADDLDVQLAVDATRDAASEAAGHDPYTQPLLIDLLELATAGDRRRDALLVARLEADVDHLHRALLDQRASEEDRLAERKLSALAEFAAGAGHEINNPLAVISGQAQYLLAGEEAPERQRPLQTIVQQAQRIHQILTELMQFARPGRPQRRPVDVRILARDTGALLHEVAALRQVRIEVEEPDEPCVAECDPRQLQTALYALLRNAVEAAAADGWARLRVETAAADRLRLVVEDAGPGPSPAEQAHMFDPFFSGRPAGRGRGLGLPTAWRLARQQGGDVTFEPLPLGPTRFVLTLPRAAAPPQGGARLIA
jgi:signal transduction histidine kinase